MSSQLAEYRSGFQALKADATRLVADVDDSTLLTSPTEGTWSVVQIFDHLNTTGRPLLNALEVAIQDGQQTGPYGKPPFEYGLLSRWFVRSMQPSSWALPAPPSLQPEPSANLPPSAPLQDFRDLQDQFADCVTSAEGLDLRRLRIPSPALPFFRVSLGAWFEATIAHERRHFEQARRCLSKLDSTSVKEDSESGGDRNPQGRSPLR
jgi:hypothetical protein